MVTKQSTTTVTFKFSYLNTWVVMRGGTNQVVTVAMLSWTTDDPVRPEDSPFLNYEVSGFECNGDWSIVKSQRTAGHICFPTERSKWEFLSELAEQIDHPEIRAELAGRVAKENA
jgi:hypothetical protein